MAPSESKHEVTSNLAPDSMSPPPVYLFKSKLPTIEIPDHLTLPQYCLQHSSKLGSKPCLIEMGQSGQATSQNHVTTFGDVIKKARCVATGLEPIAGIKKGDVVMLMIPNSSEFVISFLGAAMRGAIVTTCNPFYKSQEIEKQLSASKAKLIITQLGHIHKLTHIHVPHTFQVMVIDHEPLDIHQGQDQQNHHHLAQDHAPLDPPQFGPILSFSSFFDYSDDYQHDNFELDNCLKTSVFDDVHPDDVAALPYSSGTTGLPKGVMLTHRNLVTSISQQVDGDNPNMYFTPDDIVLCVLPMFHIYSLSIVLCCLRVGATMAIMPKFEIEALLEVVQRHRVTVAPLVPPIVLALAKNPLVQRYDLSSIRMLMCGAAPLSKDLQDSFKARVPHAIVAQGYGMTEAGSVLSMSLAFAKYPSPVKSGSCGTVLRNTVVKLIDPETGLSVPHNQPGEICIKGNQIMKGYLNDSVATSNTIDEDGFLHTGDIGIIDDDDELFIVDRVKEIIKFKGFQVPPAELEGILISHPSVTDAACVPKKDEAAGEVPVAFVVLTKGSEVTENELKQFVANQVIFYKKLHTIIFVDHIPKSPSGKILRKELRKRIEEEHIF